MSDKNPITFTIKIPKIGLEITLTGTNPWQLASVLVLISLAALGIVWIVLEGNLDARALAVGILLGATLVWTIQTHAEFRLDDRAKKLKSEYLEDIQHAWELKENVERAKSSFEPVKRTTVELKKEELVSKFTS